MTTHEINHNGSSVTVTIPMAIRSGAVGKIVVSPDGDEPSGSVSTPHRQCPVASSRSGFPLEA